MESKNLYREVQTRIEVEEIITSTDADTPFINIAFQGIDFSGFGKDLLNRKGFKNCMILGCTFSPGIELDKFVDCIVLPEMSVPFKTHLGSLYTKGDLFDSYLLADPESYKLCYDNIVYEHYVNKGRVTNSIYESLARRLHDHSITDAKYELINQFDPKQVVAVMGGHNLARTDPDYRSVAILSRSLARDGYLMVSGGGPGAMEATHLGVWMSDYTDSELDDALSLLAPIPGYKPVKDWLNTAFQVIAKYEASEKVSLGIPTWFYGWEPPTPFAAKVAKYFANSVREDNLLAIAKGGVIFAPGSAGTTQEIFQDAAQNHYQTFGFSSPMIFLNTKYWSHDRPIYPLLNQMSKQGLYKNMILSIFDTADEVASEIRRFTETK